MAHVPMNDAHLEKRRRWRAWEVWAEGGMVRVEDQDTGEYRALSRKEAILRARAFNLEIGAMTYPSDRKDASDLVDHLINAVRDAKTQGDPTDDEVSRQKGRELRRNKLAGGLIIAADAAQPAPPDRVTGTARRVFFPPSPHSGKGKLTDVRPDNLSAPRPRLWVPGG